MDWIDRTGDHPATDQAGLSPGDREHVVQGLKRSQSAQVEYDNRCAEHRERTRPDAEAAAETVVDPDVPQARLERPTHVDHLVAREADRGRQQCIEPAVGSVVAEHPRHHPFGHRDVSGEE